MLGDPDPSVSGPPGDPELENRTTVCEFQHDGVVCGFVLQRSGQDKEHKKRKHNRYATVTFSDGETLTLERLPNLVNGEFECPRCRKRLKLAQGAKDHCNGCQGPIALEGTGQALDEDLQQHSQPSLSPGSTNGTLGAGEAWMLHLSDPLHAEAVIGEFHVVVV